MRVYMKVNICISAWDHYGSPVRRNVSFVLRNVSFVLRNVSFVLRNVSLELRNVSFVLRNVSFDLSAAAKAEGLADDGADGSRGLQKRPRQTTETSIRCMESQ